ncbi:MAG: prepilin peptidase [Candidatus Omnitrophica bacterium]|nr:prepilin peptidase [Candidatus Omnitrophota bacterium]
MDPVTGWFVFAVGAIVGSFLNVCIHRMPRDLSIVLPRSFCPHCKAMIPWYENIPLVSYLLLRGRCFRCRRPIAFRYFFVELTTALIGWFLWERYGLSAEFVASAIFFAMILVATMTDFETGLIPDQITIPGMLLGLAVSVTGHGHFHQEFWYQKLLASGAGLLAGGGILLLTGWLGKLVFRKDSMGGGDVKLLAMIGAFVGVTNVGLIFLLAPFPALPFALWQRFVKKEETIPFGPFLALAGAFLFVEGDAVLHFLARTYGVY